MGLINQMKQRMAAAKEQISAEELKKAEALLEKYNMNIEEYSEADIKKANATNLRKIVQDLWGSGFDKFATKMSMNPSTRATVMLLSALVEQNWVLIRQNELIIKKLNQLQEGR